MNLAKDRFYSRDHFVLDRDGNQHPAKTYGYETYKTMYDITVVNGQKLYSVNMGPYSNLIEDIQPIHVEVEKHFKI